VPASRGRILDRNGQVLATSVPVPAVWAIPKDFKATPSSAASWRRLLGMTRRAEPNWKARAASPGCAPGRRDRCGTRSRRWASRACYQSASTSASYPEGEAAAHVVGFTNVEDKGQEGIELRFHEATAGPRRLALVVRDRLGRVVEDMGDRSTRPTAATSSCRRRQGAVLRLPAVRDAVAEHNAKAGSVVVLDVQTGEVLALANYPSYDPGVRASLQPASSCATAR
jgi:cell division protein FtsI (penicillin-binding protein 3)